MKVGSHSWEQYQINLIIKPTNTNNTFFPVGIEIVLKYIIPTDYSLLPSFLKNEERVVLDEVCGKQAENFNYWVRKVGSESEGKALFRAVIHTNAYNL